MYSQPGMPCRKSNAVLLNPKTLLGKMVNRLDFRFKNFKNRFIFLIQMSTEPAGNGSENKIKKELYKNLVLFFI